MDPLSALIDAGERTTDVRLCDPWSIALPPTPSITVVAVVAGQAWCHIGAGEPVELSPGELLVLQPRRARILTGSAERPGPVDGAAGDLEITGRDPQGPGHVIIRSYPVDAELVADFFATLPAETVLDTSRRSPLWAALEEEAGHLSVARSSALGRLLDLLFIDAMRSWAAEGNSDGWMRAVLDPLVGGVLRLFHEHPAHAWTLQELSDRFGASRVSVSRRFELFVGEPPMIYLHHWRLSRAASLLTEGTLPIATVARSTGFPDPFRFSASFSKEFGVSPARYREFGPRSAGSA